MKRNEEIEEMGNLPLMGFVAGLGIWFAIGSVVIYFVFFY